MSGIMLLFAGSATDPFVDYDYLVVAGGGGGGCLGGGAGAGGMLTGSQTEFIGTLTVSVGSGGSITIPDATFSAGDVVSVVNNTTGDVTITCSITTAYKGGANVDEATLTLATRGIATVLFISSTVCIVNGNI